MICGVWCKYAKVHGDQTLIHFGIERYVVGGIKIWGGIRLIWAIHYFSFLVGSDLPICLENIMHSFLSRLICAQGQIFSTRLYASYFAMILRCGCVQEGVDKKSHRCSSIQHKQRQNPNNIALVPGVYLMILQKLSTLIAYKMPCFRHES